LKFSPKIIIVAIVLMIVTIFFAIYIAGLLFTGKNTFETYDNLKTKKVQLEQEIKRLQKQNAMLQKEYFELKNLEPENE
jgi:cell division protein FtsB